MKVKFNKFERYAGAFIITSLFLAVFTTVVIGIQNAWFSKKYSYFTVFERLQGVFPGTQVEMAGLRAGTVETVELGPENKIIVRMSIQAKYASRIRQDSTVMTKRPFVIGEKMVEISVGTLEAPIAKPGSKLNSHLSFDLLEIADPKKFEPYFETMSRLAESLRIAAEAFTDPRRSRELIEIFDQIHPFLIEATKAAGSVHVMSQQMTKDKNLQVTLENVAMASLEIRKIIRNNPNLSGEASLLLTQTQNVLAELNKLLPVMAELAPQIPRATLKTLATLDEAIIVLKAMQRSFLLRSSVKEVLAEEKKRIEVNERSPGSDPGKTKEKLR